LGSLSKPFQKKIIHETNLKHCKADDCRKNNGFIQWRRFGRAGLWLGKIAGALLALWGLWMIVVRT
jgi:hypothetical protein